MSTQNDTVEQPTSFSFSDETREAAKVVCARYPADRQDSAVMPLLDLAQRQNDGWLPRAAMDYVAEYLQMPAIQVYEVATFYTMYNLAPVGKHHVEVCTNLPCWLRGSDKVMKACSKNLGVGKGQTTEDGMFTLSEAECLGACVNAPMMQIGDDYYEDLDEESTARILDELRAGGSPKTGSQSGRTSSEPAGGLTSLTDLDGTNKGGDA